MSVFWGQFGGTVIGSLITLIGIWLTIYWTEQKKKKESNY